MDGPAGRTRQTAARLSGSQIMLEFSGGGVGFIKTRSLLSGTADPWTCRAKISRALERAEARTGPSIREVAPISSDRGRWEKNCRLPSDPPPTTDGCNLAREPT